MIQTTPTSEFSGAEDEDSEYNADDNMLPPMDWLDSTDSIDATPTSEFSGAEGNMETPTSEFSGAEDEDGENDIEDTDTELPPMDWIEGSDSDEDLATPTSDFSGAEGDGVPITPTSEIEGGLDETDETDDVFCPEDAKECPDGSVVVRSKQ